MSKTLTPIDQLMSMFEKSTSLHVLSRLLLGLVTLYFLATAEARDLSVESKNPKVIDMNIAYSKDSLWTQEEILHRFEITKRFFSQRCSGLELRIHEMISIDDPKLQDLDGSLETDESRQQMKSALSLFKRSIRPVIFYTRKAKFLKAKLSDAWSDGVGQSYEFGGARLAAPNSSMPPITTGDIEVDTFLNSWSPGNLDPRQFEGLRDFDGMIIIGEYYSEKNRSYFSYHERLSADRHELGHVLLRNSSHQESHQNLMGYYERNQLDPAQCQNIKKYSKADENLAEDIRHYNEVLCELSKSRGSHFQGCH